MATRSYHEILGVSPNASPEDIKKAFRAAAQRLHPDKDRNNPDAKRNFQELNAAYQALTNNGGRGSSRARTNPEQAEPRQSRAQQEEEDRKRRAEESRRAEEQRKNEEKAKRDAKRRAKAENDAPLTRDRRAETRRVTKQARSERAARLKREAELRADAAYEAHLKSELAKDFWSAAAADRIAHEVREEPRRARIVLINIPMPFLASVNAATLRPILSRHEPDIYEARRTAFHVDGYNRSTPGLENGHSAYLIDRITKNPAAATAILAGLDGTRLLQDNTFYAFLWKHDQAAVMTKMIATCAVHINRLPSFAGADATLLSDFIQQDPAQATAILAKVKPASLAKLPELRNAIARTAPKSLAALMVPYHIGEINRMPSLASSDEQALLGYLQKDPSHASKILDTTRPSSLSELPFLRQALAAAEPEFYGRVIAPYYIKQMDNALFPDHSVPPLIDILERAPQLAEAMEKRIAPRHLQSFGALRKAIEVAKTTESNDGPTRSDARRRTAQAATHARG